MPKRCRPWEPIARRLSPDVLQRYHAKIRRGAPNECWEWQGALNRCGYGAFIVRGVSGPVGAHRIAWALAHGAPGINEHVLHHCDNRKCCNPAHLWIGTHADNMRDMAQKGRAAKQKLEECIHGHPYVPGSFEVTYSETGRPRRHCLTCRSDRETRKASERTEAVRGRLDAYLWPELRVFAERHLPPTFLALSAKIGHRRALVLAYSLAAYGFPYRTLTDVGTEFGISRERTRQLREDGLAKLGVTAPVPNAQRIAVIESSKHLVSESLGFALGDQAAQNAA